MGKRGPKTKGGRASADISRPYAPRGLDDVAKLAWDRLCDDLEASGTLDKTDRHLIELYANTYSLWLKVEAELFGQLLAIMGESSPKSPPGDEKVEKGDGRQASDFPYRLVNLHLSIGARIRQLLLDCGLSPSSRPPRDAETGGFWESMIGAGRDGGI